jgi:hypothetical protein
MFIEPVTLIDSPNDPFPKPNKATAKNKSTKRLLGKFMLWSMLGYSKINLIPRRSQLLLSRFQFSNGPPGPFLNLFLCERLNHTHSMQ